MKREARDAVHKCREGKFGEHQSLLRRPRHRSANCPYPWLSVKRPGVGKAGTRFARRGLSRDYLRPERIRPIESAMVRLRLRYICRGPESNRGQTRLASLCPGGPFDGWRRGGALSRQI